MAEVDILLAAYNGEKFIAEQIDSLLSQTFQDFRILIRDDGSSDNTPEIIEAYARKFPDKIEVIHDEAVCRSPAKNFFQLLKHATADYVMFSDQDDVWLKYKIQITLDYMKDAERDNPGKPVLIFTGLQIVDAELKSMGRLMSLDFPEVRYSFRELLACNYAAGCTQMLNRRLYAMLGEYDESMGLHDSWVSLYAAGLGVIVRVPMALILYRQHSNNVVGGVRKYDGWRERVSKLYDFISRPFIFKDKFYSMQDQAALFRSMYFRELSPEKQQQIDEYLKLFGKNRLTRILTLRRAKYIYFEKLSIMHRLFLMVKMLLF